MKKLQLKKEVVEKLDGQKMGNAFGGAATTTLSILEQNSCPEFCNTNASFRVDETACTQPMSDGGCGALTEYDQINTLWASCRCGTPSAKCITNLENSNCC
jgi:hypothetical protein